MSYFDCPKCGGSFSPHHTYCPRCDEVTVQLTDQLRRYNDHQDRLALSPRWHYYSENLMGNLHDAAYYITRAHPEWDVIAMSCVTNTTVVVYRLPFGSLEDDSKQSQLRAQK
jgi:hypothetical protein